MEVATYLKVHINIQGGYKITGRVTTIIIKQVLISPIKRFAH